MLVLSRKEGERIRIGDSIVVTVVRAGGDKVRIGIEAPGDVIVLRDELEPRPKNHKSDGQVETVPPPEVSDPAPPNPLGGGGLSTSSPMIPVLG